MDWKDSPVGQWIDRKVAELGFEATGVFIGDWNEHVENCRIFQANDFEFFWFGRASNEYAQDFVPLYFVKVEDARRSQGLISLFKQMQNLVYARFYRATDAMGAMHRPPTDE